MSKPNEYTDNFKSNFTSIFLSVRGKLKKPLCPRTLCTYNRIEYKSTQDHGMNLTLPVQSTCLSTLFQDFVHTMYQLNEKNVFILTEPI